MCVRTSTSHIHFQNDPRTFVSIVTIAYGNIIDLHLDRPEYFLFIYERRYVGTKNGGHHQFRSTELQIYMCATTVQRIFEQLFLVIEHERAQDQLQILIFGRENRFPRQILLPCLRELSILQMLTRHTRCRISRTTGRYAYLQSTELLQNVHKLERLQMMEERSRNVVVTRVENVCRPFIDVEKLVGRPGRLENRQTFSLRITDPFLVISLQATHMYREYE